MNAHGEGWRGGVTRMSRGGPASGVVLVETGPGPHADALRRAYGHVLPGAAPDGPMPFGARALLRLEPDVGVRSIFAPQVSWSEPAGEDALVLIRPVGGRLAVEQGGVRVEADPRDAILVSMARDARYRFHGVRRVDLFRAERARLPVPVGGPSRVSRDHPGLQMLSVYAAALLRGLMPAPIGPMQALVRDHLHQLLAFTLADGAREPAPGPPSPRETRLRALRAEIEVRLGRRDLSLQLVAQLLQVSPRHVQQIFADAGETFSSFVLGRRLDRAMEMMAVVADPRPIGDIAFEVGFGDLSYFNRTFRKRFGLTPSLARRRARAEGS